MFKESNIYSQELLLQSSVIDSSIWVNNTFFVTFIALLVLAFLYQTSPYYFSLINSLYIRVKNKSFIKKSNIKKEDEIKENLKNKFDSMFSE